MKLNLSISLFFLSSVHVVSCMQSVQTPPDMGQHNRSTVLRRLENICAKTDQNNHALIQQLSRAYTVCCSDRRRECTSAYIAALTLADIMRKEQNSAFPARQ